MAIEFFGTREQQELVSATFDNIYAHYSSNQKFTQKEAHFQPFCNIASLLLIQTMRRMGIEAGLMSRRPLFGGLEANFHDFVSLGNTWIADMTWQQFLDKENRSNYSEEVVTGTHPPKVLLCRMDDLAQEVQKWGLKKNQLHWWTKAKLIPYKDYVSALDPVEIRKTHWEWRRSKYDLAVMSITANQLY